MKKILLPLILVFTLIKIDVLAQVSQISLGNSGSTESFVDTRYATTDGGSISVGYINNGVDNDLFAAKFNSAHQLVWQKTIPNSGDDIFYKVVVCANGDYVAAGQIFQSGIRRGITCRFSSETGSILWSKITSNSSVGELFWNVFETSNNNIALVGVDQFAGGITNSFIVLLNSAGNNIWSLKSSTVLADEFRSVSQLPNGNLIVGGFYNPNGFNYPLTILELNETTGSVVAQNVYEINESVPLNPFSVNSLWPLNFYIRNSTVLLEVSTFTGFGSASHDCMMTYDQTSKVLSGNIYYHSSAGTLTADCIFPISANDYLVSLSSSGPNEVFISRVTNGNIVFDKKIDNSINLISSIDTSSTEALLGGSYTNTDLDAFRFYSPSIIPTSTLPCNISNANRLMLQPLNLNPTALNVITLSATAAMSDISFSSQSTSLVPNSVCEALPINLLSFEGTYNNSNKIVNLSWKTTSEFNSKVFEIERSNNGGMSYLKIGKLPAKGYANTISNYFTTDNNPANGINLYRLKQLDNDNTFKYSGIVSVKVTNTQTHLYKIYPIPANQYTYIYPESNELDIININIFDNRGNSILLQNNNVTSSLPIKLDCRNLNAGIYYVKITTSMNKTEIHKLIVQ